VWIYTIAGLSAVVVGFVIISNVTGLGRSFHCRPEAYRARRLAGVGLKANLGYLPHPRHQGFSPVIERIRSSCWHVAQRPR
jgi:hypothetical protein